jgi:hypothetical protein
VVIIRASEYDERHALRTLELQLSFPMDKATDLWGFSFTAELKNSRFEFISGTTMAGIVWNKSAYILFAKFESPKIYFTCA